MSGFVINPSKGDVLIKKVSNGFIALGESSIEGEYRISVYEFNEAHGEVAEAEALYSLIFDQFSGVFQSKHKGGLEIIVHNQGRNSSPKGS